MPPTIHEKDARFREFNFQGVEGQKCSRICCDCEGCLSSEVLESLVVRGRQYIEDENWFELADMLIDRCCSLRKRLFPDEEPVFFARTDGNWKKEAWWCGGGQNRKDAWAAGLVDGRWYCHPCLAKITGYHDVTDLRTEWVDFYGEKLSAMGKEFRRRCALVLERQSNENIDSGGNKTRRGLTQSAQADVRKRKADAMATTKTPESDRKYRVDKLVTEFQRLHVRRLHDRANP